MSYTIIIVLAVCVNTICAVHFLNIILKLILLLKVCFTFNCGTLVILHLKISFTVQTNLKNYNFMLIQIVYIV